VEKKSENIRENGVGVRAVRKKKIKEKLGNKKRKRRKEKNQVKSLIYPSSIKEGDVKAICSVYGYIQEA